MSMIFYSCYNFSWQFKWVSIWINKIPINFKWCLTTIFSLLSNSLCTRLKPRGEQWKFDWNWFSFYFPVGPVLVIKTPPELSVMEKNFTEVRPGGRGFPTNCNTSHHVAIIIPYRNRPQHLQTLLYNLHPILLRQQIDYQIFIVEQEGEYSFVMNPKRNISRSYLQKISINPQYKKFPILWGFAW